MNHNVARSHRIYLDVNVSDSLIEASSNNFKTPDCSVFTRSEHGGSRPESTVASTYLLIPRRFSSFFTAQATRILPDAYGRWGGNSGKHGAFDLGRAVAQDERSWGAYAPPPRIGAWIGGVRGIPLRDCGKHASLARQGSWRYSSPLRCSGRVSTDRLKYRFSPPPSLCEKASYGEDRPQY